MSDLRRIVRSHEEVLTSRGFARATSIDRGPTYDHDGCKFVVYDRIRGGDLRCFLCVRAGAATDDGFDIEGESPWWRTEYDQTLESAVTASLQFLIDVGFAFLEDPLARTPTEWREQHNILVRDKRKRTVHFFTHQGMDLNRAVMICTRSHPTLKGQPALQVRQVLGPKIEIPSVVESLAFALEIQKKCEAEGLIVRIEE